MLIDRENNIIMIMLEKSADFKTFQIFTYKIAVKCNKVRIYT